MPLPGRLTARRFGCRLLVGAVVLALSGVTVVGSGAPAWATKKPVIPSQQDVDKAKADASAKAEQIGQTKANLAAADAELAKLNDSAEAAVEAYNGAMVKLDAAKQAVGAAQAALQVAEQNRAKAQLEMNRFAANSYRGSGNLGQISALITSGSPQTLLDREAILGAISRHQQGIIDLMRNAVSAQDAAEKAADAALAQRQKASDTAANAKDAAVAAMNTQAGQVAQIKDTQAQLQAQLAVLQGKAKNLAAARAEGLRELAAQREAERRAAAAAAAAAKKHQEELARQAAAANNHGGSSTVVSQVEYVTPGTGHSVSTPAQRATAVAFAQSKIGIWYRWAGAGEINPTVTDDGIQNVEGYDCSGLTMRAYQAAGISLGHYTGLQWDEGMHVSRDDLQPGDLVFFATDTSNPATIHHVGIYIGGGKMIDAPETGRQIGVHNAFRPDYIGAVRP
jgi:cell wall-associated NlpC family hydrolase